MEPVTKQPYDGIVAYTDAYTDPGNVAMQIPMQPPQQNLFAPPPVTVVTSQPTSTTIINLTQVNYLYPRGIPRDWSTPLCGCFDDCGDCLLSFFCHPCHMCHVASKMGEGCCAPCCLCNPALTMRAYFRGRHNIQGSLVNDACTVCWCTQCAMCQISREIDNMKFGRAMP